MSITARHLLLAALATATTLTACGSDKPTGPSSRSLAQLFDSAFVADTVGGHTARLRPQIELVAALIADEGITPITVQLTTASGSLSMQMMALAFYDTTVAGTPSDSGAIIVGWTTDFQKYLALTYTVIAGTESSAQHIRVAGNLAAFLPHTTRQPHADAVIGVDDGRGIVVQGDSAAVSDSSSGNITWSATSGHCAWQHVPISFEKGDSTLACSPATVTTNFSLLFPRQPGVDASLTIVTMPTKALPAARIVGSD